MNSTQLELQLPQRGCALFSRVRDYARPLVLGAGTFLLATLAGSFATAAIVNTYVSPLSTDRSAWLGDLDGPAMTEDFETNGLGALSNPDTLDTTGWQISWVPAVTTAGTPTIVNSGSQLLDTAVGDGTQGEPTSVTFNFAAPINAWGADFIDANTSNSPPPAAGILIQTNNGASEQVDLAALLDPGNSNGGNGFLGITTDQTFTSITITAASSFAEVFQLDNLAVGLDSDALPSPPSVPEPSTLMLIGLGMGSLALRRRRHTR